MSRLFVGVALDDAARTALAPVLAAFRGARVPDVRDLHVTLLFLGEVAPERVADVITALEAVAAMSPGTAAIREFGAFPEHGPARVVHARVDDHGGVLSSLSARTAALLAPLGFVREARPFSPHVTLARLDAKSPALVLPHAPLELDIAIPVHAVSLFESRHGVLPRYEVLHTFPLVTSTSVRAGPGRQETHDHRPPA